MLRKIAWLISILFHPMFMCLVGVFIIFNTPTYLNFGTILEHKKEYYVFIFVHTIIFPSIILFGISLFREPSFKRIMLSSISHRRMPYLISLLFYLLTIAIIYYKNAYVTYIFAFLIGCTICIAAAFLLSLARIKISAHMIGLGGIMGLLIGLSGVFSINLIPQIASWLLISGLVASSRLILGEHTPAQIYLGFLLGFFVQFGLILS